MMPDPPQLVHQQVNPPLAAAGQGNHADPFPAVQRGNDQATVRAPHGGQLGPQGLNLPLNLDPTQPTHHAVNPLLDAGQGNHADPFPAVQLVNNLAAQQQIMAPVLQQPQQWQAPQQQVPQQPFPQYHVPQQPVPQQLAAQQPVPQQLAAQQQVLQQQAQQPVPQQPLQYQQAQQQAPQQQLQGPQYHQPAQMQLIQPAAGVHPQVGPNQQQGHLAHNAPQPNVVLQQQYQNLHAYPAQQQQQLYQQWQPPVLPQQA